MNIKLLIFQSLNDFQSQKSKRRFDNYINVDLGSHCPEIYRFALKT